MMTRAAIILVAAFGATACMVGPDYHRPDVPTPAAWGELAPAAPPTGRGDVVVGTPIAWWTSFGDELLVSTMGGRSKAKPSPETGR